MDRSGERARRDEVANPDRRAVLGALATGVALAGCAGLPGNTTPGGQGDDGEDEDDNQGNADGEADGTDGSGDGGDGDGDGGDGEDSPAPATTGWFQFRADAANSGHAGGTGPRADAVRWRVDLPGAARGAPAAVDGTAYLATGDGFRAYRTADGSEQWRVDLPMAPGTTPAVGADAVFVATESGAARVSRDGELGWQRSLAEGNESLQPHRDGTVGSLRSAGRPTEPFRSNATDRLQSTDPAHPSPTVGGNRVYVAVGTELLALGTGTGETRWRTDLDDVPRTAAVLGNGELRVGVGSDVVGLDPSGAVRFRTPVGDGASAAAVVDGISHVTARDANGRTVVAACGPDGETRWRTVPATSDVQVTRLDPPDDRLGFGAGISTTQRSYTPTSAPAVTPEGVYAGTETGVAALDREGAVRWRVGLEGVEGDPAVVGDRVYAVTGRAVVVLDRADGSERRRTRISGGQQAAIGGGARDRFATGGLQIETGPTTAPAVADGVYVPVVSEGGIASLVAVD